jgi:hypothetical protein
MCGYTVKFTASFLLFYYLLTLVQAAVIIPFGVLGEGANLTVTCITTNGGGAGAIALVNENGTAYLGVGGPFVQSSNTSVARFEYGPVRMSDSGLKFVCDNTIVGGTRSLPITLQVLCRPTLTQRPRDVSVPLAVVQVRELFSLSVGGCTGIVTITCSGARIPLSFVSNDSEILLDGLHVWSRTDFGQEEGAFSVNLNCIAEQRDITSAPVTVTVRARALLCGGTYMCICMHITLCDIKLILYVSDTLTLREC